jgi:hypothetical protein
MSENIQVRRFVRFALDDAAKGGNA